MNNILSFPLFESLKITKRLYAHHLEPGALEMLMKIDKTRTFKYLPKIAAFYLGGSEVYDIEAAIREFDEKCNRNLIANKDINAYETLEDLQNALADSKNISGNQQRKETKAGAVVVLKTPQILVVNPLTHESSQYYGSETKWCIAGDNDDYWEEYVDEYDGTFYFVFIRDRKMAEELSKFYVDKIKDNYEWDEDDDCTEEEYHYELGNVYNFTKFAVGVVPDGRMSITNAYDKICDPYEDFFRITGLDEKMFTSRIK